MLDLESEICNLEKKLLFPIYKYILKTKYMGFVWNKPKPHWSSCILPKYK